LCRRANKESTEVRSMPQLFAMRRFTELSLMMLFS
jgi:hypothetical protein